MGRQIIKQPQGDLYAVWSSICDDFIYVNLTPQDIIDAFVCEATEQIEKDVMTKITDLHEGKGTQFTKTWEKALKRRNEIHGNADDFATTFKI